MVDELDHSALVEISDDDGRTLELIAVPEVALAVVTPPRQERLAF